MPIPDQSDFGDRLGIPAAYGPQQLTNRLRTGTLIHYVQPGTGTHVQAIIHNVANMTTGEISVMVPDASRPAGRYEQANVLYDDATKPQGTWHFLSDG